MDELRNRIGSGIAATIGGCHFSPVLLRKGVAGNDKEETLIYRLFRETGRKLGTISIGVDDEVVFAGCWLVKSQHAGTLHALGNTGRIRDGFDCALINKNMPEDWRLIPHRARQAIPVLTTLDGGLIYPQIEGYKNQEADAPLEVRFFGMAENPVFVANTAISITC